MHSFRAGWVITCDPSQVAAEAACSIPVAVNAAVNVGVMALLAAKSVAVKSILGLGFGFGFWDPIAVVV